VCTHSVPHDGHEGSYKQDLELREAGRVETVALIVKLQRLQTHRRTVLYMEFLLKCVHVPLIAFSFLSLLLCGVTLKQLKGSFWHL